MRIAKWDNVKFFLIYCVVLGHVAAILETDSQFLSSIHLFIYSFHMPAFLFLSGLFSKSTVDHRRYDRIMSYLVLYLFMKVFRFVVYSLIAGKAVSFSLLSESGLPWFALVVFFSYLMTIALSGFQPWLAVTIAVVTGIMAGYGTDLGDFLCGMRLFTLYPFFLIGYYCPVDRLSDFTGKKSVKFCAAAVLLVVLGICFVRGDALSGLNAFFKCKVNYDSLGLLPWGGLYRGLYYAAALLLTVCVIAVIPSTQTVLTIWGKRTIQVYALHYPVLKALCDVFHMEELLSRLWPAHYALLAPIVALILTILLSAKIFEPVFSVISHPANKKVRNAA